jgi:peptidase A4-like protein
MKSFSILFLLILVSFFATPADAQIPSPNCLGACPTVHPSSSSSQNPLFGSPSTAAPSTVPSSAPAFTSPVPAPIATNPSPTGSNLCTTTQPQLTYRSWGRHRRGKKRGFLQQGSSSLIQLIMQLLQQFGIQIPGLSSCPTGTTQPVTGITPSSSPAISTFLPSNTPSSAPTFTPTSAIVPTSAPSGGGTTGNLPDSSLSNWAGYAYTVTNGTTKATITSTWANSVVTCNNRGIVSPWPGFGGYSDDNNIAQLGEDFDCTSGTVSYNPWSEAYPANSVYYNNPTSQGDTVTASVTFNGNGAYSTTMSDTTKGWTITVPMKFTSGALTPLNGEVIVENVGSGTTSPIPNFSPIIFKNSNFSFGGATAQGISAAPGLVKMDLGSGNKATTTTSSVTGGAFTISKL